MDAVIYGLRCPILDCVRYIGKSKKPYARLATHLKAARDNRVQHHCARWIRGLLAQGLRPTLEILHHVSSTEDWQEVECRVIAEHRAAGSPLTNMTSGGEGWRDGHPEILERMRASLKEVYSTPEKREASRVRANALFADPEFRARHSAGRIRALSAPNVRAKMSATAKEIAARPGKLEAMSASAKAEWARRRASMSAAEYEQYCEQQASRLTALHLDPAYKARFVAATQSAEVHARRVASRAAPESKAKCVAKLLAAWADPERRAKRIAGLQTSKYKAKLSAIQKVAWSDPEAKARRIASMLTPEARAKNSAAQKAAWARRKAANASAT